MWRNNKRSANAICDDHKISSSRTQQQWITIWILHGHTLSATHRKWKMAQFQLHSSVTGEEIQESKCYLFTNWWRAARGRKRENQSMQWEFINPQAAILSLQWTEITVSQIFKEQTHKHTHKRWFFHSVLQFNLI